MDDNDALNVAAFAMFRTDCRSRGLSKSEADEAWNKIGPAGRSYWRLLARAAFEAVGLMFWR